MNPFWLDFIRRVGASVLALASFGVGIALAADVIPDPSVSGIRLSSQPMDINGSWDYALDNEGRLWLAYYDQAQLLHLIDPSRQERLLASEGRGKAPSGLDLVSLRRGVGVLWRDKLPSKELYLLDLDAAHENQVPLGVGGDTEPLARFVASEDKAGRLHLLWYGEKKLDESSELHNLYYRQLDSKTQELSPIEWVTPGIYPLLSVGDSGDMVYSWMKTALGNQIVSRFRPENGTFAEAVPVATVPEISPVFEAFRSGSRWFTVWLAQYGADKRDFRLEGAHSDDDGKTWTRFEISGLAGRDIGSLQIVSDEAGHILMAATGRKRLPGVETKQDVFLVRSFDRGDTWETMSEIRGGTTLGKTVPAKMDLSQFSARNPVVAFGEKPGEVLFVWEDWRDIRGKLYASLSNDYGRTWALSNVPLTADDGKSYGLRFEPNALFFSEGKFHVIAERAVDDTFTQKELVELSVTAEDLTRLAKAGQSRTSLDTKDNQDALREREKGFWKAMEDKDFEATYAYLDPFFRARVPLQRYLSMMGKIKYDASEVESVSIDGSRAEVVAKIKASIPAFKAPTTGETLSQPEREASVKSHWLWVDGNWYREFLVESRGIVFSRY
ncbi:hypothetical protein ThidrDRAFT_0142 [Thiorhodococcus drewsii AZ1]|uniref:Sialidase domain-containing protein n=1 Tax=Thiorhodococcus drewsii AZ1 TaxID=765913 RepID=G2DVH2_9GAMM|nr:hypothetical protein ThidrDRAFT_0142 [Thiorhodococcus drewsii AZ1]